MSKEPKLCVLGVLGGKENFEAIALQTPSASAEIIELLCYNGTLRVKTSEGECCCVRKSKSA